MNPSDFMLSLRSRCLFIFPVLSYLCKAELGLALLFSSDMELPSSSNSVPMSLTKSPNLVRMLDASPCFELVGRLPTEAFWDLMESFTLVKFKWLSRLTMPALYISCSSSARAYALLVGPPAYDRSSAVLRLRLVGGTTKFCLNLAPKSNSNSALSIPRSSWTCSSPSIFRGKLTAQFYRAKFS